MFVCCFWLRAGLQVREWVWSIGVVELWAPMEYAHCECDVLCGSLGGRLNSCFSKMRLGNCGEGGEGEEVGVGAEVCAFGSPRGNCGGLGPEISAAGGLQLPCGPRSEEIQAL